MSLEHTDRYFVIDVLRCGLLSIKIDMLLRTCSLGAYFSFAERKGGDIFFLDWQRVYEQKKTINSKGWRAVSLELPL